MVPNNMGTVPAQIKLLLPTPGRLLQNIFRYRPVHGPERYHFHSKDAVQNVDAASADAAQVAQVT